MSYDRSLVVPQAQESMSTTSATTSSFEPYSIPLDPYNDASDQSTSTIQQQQQRIVSVVTSAEVTNDSIFGLPVVRDWNAEYQGTLERMKSAASDQLACMVQLRDLAEDFVETAERYGRIIVSERHVSHELKTSNRPRSGVWRAARSLSCMAFCSSLHWISAFLPPPHRHCRSGCTAAARPTTRMRCAPPVTSSRASLP
jgi:hypothetical protein